jgi:hypothetical protein
MNEEQEVTDKKEKAISQTGLKRSQSSELKTD